MCRIGPKDTCKTRVFILDENITCFFFNRAQDHTHFFFVFCVPLRVAFVPPSFAFFLSVIAPPRTLLCVFFLSHFSPPLFLSFPFVFLLIFSFPPLFAFLPLFFFPLIFAFLLFFSFPPPFSFLLPFAASRSHVSSTSTLLFFVNLASSFFFSSSFRRFSFSPFFRFNSSFFVNLA